MSNPTLNVLIADGDPTSCLLYKRAIARLGMNIEIANDGKQALIACESKLPDILIVDWHMPHMLGIEVLAEVRKRYDKQPYAIMATSRSTAEDVTEAMKSGADDFITKPVSVAEMEARVRIAETHLQRDRELQSARDELEKSQRLQSLANLSTGVAHDIRNGLGPIIAYAQLLQLRHGSDDKTQRQLGTILQSCERMRVMVDQLLLFASIEAAPLSHIDIREIAMESLGQWISKIPPNISLDINVDEEPEMTVMGNRKHLVTCFDHLIENAIDSMKERNGQISFRVAKNEEGTEVRVEISDQGVGIAAKDMPRIFDPFFSTKERSTSTGLGLSIVYGITRHADAHIELESKAGQGTQVALIYALIR